MSKKSFWFFVIFSAAILCYAEKVVVAPFVVYDQNGNKEINTVADEVYNSLGGHWFEGLLEFYSLSSKDYGDILTLVDANKVCSMEESEYILYGFVQKNNNYLFADIKLYDSVQKKIVREFFSADEKTEYSRFLDLLESRIIVGLEDLTGIENRNIEQELYDPFKIYINLDGQYWNPVDENWINVITGIVGGNLGVEVFPPQKPFVFNNVKFGLSGYLGFGYNYGMGKENAYPLNYHGINVCSMLFCNISFDSKNTVFIGTGPFYEYEFLDVVEKYEDEAWHYQNMVGIRTTAGYRFDACKILALYFKTSVIFHLSDDSFVAVEPDFGLSFKFGGRN